ncbi:nicotinate-nucleotide adenylyltransferase [Candidatus Accumulibacter sp. ACC003]|uniref:nicotinate-nucleotide adenylyltransferase n=1 Tax=Candidatus Accumulibacter sp. ACC003 TaxID=2823334 RepID=UPI0025C57E66|nr:nicotinate-nucleotide adenylyltransferase [Candidatus Accumulibacter sp. ACC003]
MPERLHDKPLGIFGGTFDPVHFGHLRLAEEAADQLDLAGVRWIPAGQPALREAPQVTAQQRLAMVRMATAENRSFDVDAAEVHAAQPSYTVLTLERLRQADQCGGLRPLVLLLGADAFTALTGWHRWQSLLELAHIAVAHRPGFPIDVDALPEALAACWRERFCSHPAALAEAPAGRIASFAMTQLAISATQIRTLLANGRSPRYLLPDELIAYIRNQHLYPEY